MLPSQLYLLCLPRRSLGEGGSLIPRTPLYRSTLHAALAQFADVTRVKERLGLFNRR